MKKFSKVIALCLAGVILLGGLVAGVATYQPPKVTLDNGTIYQNVKLTSTTTIVGFEEKVSGDVIVPEKINGKTVVKVDTGTNVKITKLTLSSSVKQVVANSTALKEFDVPTSNKHFKDVDGVLYSADGKTLVRYPVAKTGSRYTVGEGCQIIGEQSFKGATKLVTIVLSTTAKEIGDLAFFQCDKLTALTVSNAPLEKYGTDCFGGCTALQEIHVPQTVTSLAYGFLGVGNGIESIVVEEGNENYVVENGVLYNAEKTEVIACPLALNQEVVTVLDTVTTVASYAFRGNYKYVKTVNLSNAQKICTNAFYYTNVKHVVLDNVHTIEDFAFNQCHTIDHLIIASGCKISQYAFATCFADLVLNDTKPLFKPKWQKNLPQTVNVYFHGEWQQLQNGTPLPLNTRN